MKIGCNTWGYKNLSAEAAIGRVGALGFSGIELIAHPPGCHLAVDAGVAEMARVKKLTDEQNLEIIAISPATDYLRFTESEQEEMITHTCKSIDLCARMGVKLDRIFSGGNVPEGRSWEECVETVIKILRPCVRFAENRGVTLAMESHGKFGSDPRAIRTMLDEIKSPHLKITLDFANFMLCGYDPLEATRLLAKDIVHTHFKDMRNPVGGGKPERAVLGAGDIAYGEILSVLDAAGYEGWYVVEYEVDEKVDEGSRKGKEFLETLLKNRATA
jgi:sugar phosphate isomerase/epimerase